MTSSRVPGACGSDACEPCPTSRSSYTSTPGPAPERASGRLSILPSPDFSTWASLRRSSDTDSRLSPISSANGILRPTATFHSTLSDGLVLQVSICDSAARLTPDSLASSSRDRCETRRRSRRLSATRRPSSAAPASSPGATVGRAERALRAAPEADAELPSLDTPGTLAYLSR